MGTAALLGRQTESPIPEPPKKDEPKERDPNDKEVKYLPVLSEKYMEEHWDELDHDKICMYEKMSTDFITRHQADINFRLLSINPNITIEILDKFATRIDWMSICINGKFVSDVILYNYYNHIYWTILLAKQQLDLKLLIALCEKYRKSRAKNRDDFWKAISRYQDIDIEFVEIYKRYIKFNLLALNPYLTEDIMDKYVTEFNPKLLFTHHTLSKEFLEKYRSLFKAFASPGTAVHAK